MFFFQFYHQHWIKQGHKGSTVLDIAGCDQLAMTGAKHHPLSMTRSQSAMLIALGAPLLLPGTQLSAERHGSCIQKVMCLALPCHHQAPCSRLCVSKHTPRSPIFPQSWSLRNNTFLCPSMKLSIWEHERLRSLLGAQSNTPGSKPLPHEQLVNTFCTCILWVSSSYFFFRISMLKCVHQGKAGLNSFGSQHKKMFCMCLQCRLLFCPYCWQGLLRHPTQTQSQWHRDCAWSSEDPNPQIKFEI